MGLWADHGTLASLKCQSLIQHELACPSHSGMLRDSGVIVQGLRGSRISLHVTIASE